MAIDQYKDFQSIIDAEFHEFEESDIPELDKYFYESLQEILDKDDNDVFRIIPEGDQKVVVIGDIHCDYNALTGILYKLSISTYDYWGKAVFVFIGDYIDRGLLPFETLRLLLDIKKILGERCLILKGNHDQFYFDHEKGRFQSVVNPAETIDFFYDYLKFDTIALFKEYFDKLPYFAILERGGARFLLVHGSIPRDDFAEHFNINNFNSLALPIKADSRVKAKIYHCLNSMLWGDPINEPYRDNFGLTRFEFGQEQFMAFMKKNNFTTMIRGHEPKKSGFESIFDDRLITVFSTGGIGNNHSGYDHFITNPSFIIIDESGNVIPENIFNIKLELNDSIQSNTFNEGKVSNQDFFYDIIDTQPFRFFTNYAIWGSKNRLNNVKTTEKLFLNEEFRIAVHPQTSLDDLPEIFARMIKSKVIKL